MSTTTLPAAEALPLGTLIAATPHGTASRMLSKTEHTSPHGAIALVLEGRLQFTIGGTAVTAGPGDIVRMPATVPHALEAPGPCRMLLVLLRES